MDFQTLKLEIADHVAWVRLNRPDKANSMNAAMWDEIPRAMAWLEEQPAARVAVIAGEGRNFCGGIDVTLLAQAAQHATGKGCPARGREKLRKFILQAQASLSSIEQLRIPVIAAVHGACIGAGVDLIAACDLRYATLDAKFCIKEVDLAVAADVGTLQRLRHVIGLPMLSELTYTAETISGERAQQIGLVGRAYATQDELTAAVGKLAATIAAKSPVTVRGIKHNLLYARDHSVAESLNYQAAWNAAMLVSEDAGEAMAAHAQRRAARFAD